MNAVAREGEESPPGRRRAFRSIPPQKIRQFLAKRTVLLYLCNYQKENTPHARLPRSRPAGRPLRSVGRARPRLAKFQREQLIVEYLNRGVSVAEIAARVGLSEKRMRAVIREILARRMPHPPEEFVAIQVSRLNEALLVAYSAMSLTNLKAVDQVVKNRARARPLSWLRRRRAPPSRAARTEAPAEGTMTFGAALVCRPEFPLAPLQRGEGWGEGLGGLAAAASHPAPHPNLLPAGGEKGRFAASAGDDRPGIPPQAFEKIESAPGNSPRPASAGRGLG